MRTFVVLLRAINVGGRNRVPMAGLRAALESAGYSAVRTLLQSGNVVLEAPASHASNEIERRVAEIVSREFSVDIDVIVRTAEQWRAIVDGNPFAEQAASDPSHLLVMPMKSAPGADALKKLRGVIAGAERVEANGTTVYVVYPDGIGTSKLTGGMIEKHLGSAGTARNWNTVLKIAELTGA
jgi:uncharacterized protein (DUF1697 family)